MVFRRIGKEAVHPVFSIIIGVVIGTGTMIYVRGVDRTVMAAPPMVVAQAAPGEKPIKHWGAQDHQELAKGYEEQADEFQAQAIEYEERAAAITPLTDTKGYRRAGLTIAAGMQWKAVRELRELAALHRGEATRLLAKETRQ